MTKTVEIPLFSEDQLIEMRNRLDPRQREIHFRRIRFGYHRIQSLSYKAKDLKLSRERIRQIQNESLVRLNNPEITHLVLLAEVKATFERKERRRDKLKYNSLCPTENPMKSAREVVKAESISAYAAWNKEEDQQLLGEAKSG